MRIAALIPAYRPGQSLVDLASRLSESALNPILIVDGGGGAAYTRMFEQCRRMPKVRVLEHPANRGKGAALKTGLRHLLENSPSCAGVVTADADGQHHADDVLKIAERLAADPAALVLGARDFGPAVPRRNRLGNLMTRAVLHLLNYDVARTPTVDDVVVRWQALEGAVVRRAWRVSPEADELVALPIEQANGYAVLKGLQVATYAMIVMEWE